MLDSLADLLQIRLCLPLLYFPEGCSEYKKAVSLVYGLSLFLLRFLFCKNIDKILFSFFPLALDHAGYIS